jgi:uncharacterized protein involved in exopolysaccharide biosynthesis
VLLAALLPTHYRATASIAIMPSPEFTVREDAGSREINNSALAMDQIMKAETEILESDDLHEVTINEFDKNARRQTVLDPSFMREDGVALMYPDLGLIINESPIWKFAGRTANWILTPWRGAPPQGQDSRMFTALRRFASHLRVLPTKDSNVIDVTFEHTNPAISSRALNEMLATYAARRERIYNDPQFAVAEHETEVAANAMSSAAASLTAFKASQGLSDLPEERELLLRRRSQAEQGLADAASSLAQADARQSVLDAQILDLPKNNSIFQEVDIDTKLQTLDDSLVDLRGRLAAALPHYRETSRAVMDLKNQIRSRQTEREATTRDTTPSVKRAGRSPALDPLLVDRAHALAEIGAAKAAESAARIEIDQLDGELRRLGSAETRLSELTRRKAAADDRFASASRASGEQKLTEAEDERRLANIRIIQSARIPQRPTWTKALICLSGIVTAGIAAWSYLILRFVITTTFLTAAGLAHATGVPVLAVISGPAQRRAVGV